jgi:hypothetical protein
MEKRNNFNKKNIKKKRWIGKKKTTNKIKIKKQ